MAEQQLTLINKNKLSITEVTEVTGFDEKVIDLSLSDGGGLVIKGRNLKVLSFDGVSKNFSAGGEISSMTFKDNTEAVKKFFK